MPNLGDIFPDFEAQTTHGNIKFHDWLGNSWGILFSHPADFTPVCTTELSALILLMPLFKIRGIKVIALSCDSLESHNSWIKDIEAYTGDYNVGNTMNYPIIADVNKNVSVTLKMIVPEEKVGLSLTCRGVFIIGPDKKLKLSMLYPITTGHNFDEILRVIDSLQLTEQKNVATPADWKFGQDCLVPQSVKEEDVAKLFPFGIHVVDVPSELHYLRVTPQPD